MRGVTEEKAQSAVMERDGLAKQWFCVIRLWGHPSVSLPRREMADIVYGRTH